MTNRPYICETCGSFERMESMKDSTLKICPTCGGSCKIDFKVLAKESLMSTLPAYMDVEVNKMTGIKKGYRNRNITFNGYRSNNG